MAARETELSSQVGALAAEGKQLASQVGALAAEGKQLASLAADAAQNVKEGMHKASEIKEKVEDAKEKAEKAQEMTSQFANVVQTGATTGTLDTTDAQGLANNVGVVVLDVGTSPVQAWLKEHPTLQVLFSPILALLSLIFHELGWDDLSAWFEDAANAFKVRHHWTYNGWKCFVHVSTLVYFPQTVMEKLEQKFMPQGKMTSWGFVDFFMAMWCGAVLMFFVFLWGLQVIQTLYSWWNRSYSPFASSKAWYIFRTGQVPKVPAEPEEPPEDVETGQPPEPPAEGEEEPPEDVETRQSPPGQEEMIHGPQTGKEGTTPQAGGEGPGQQEMIHGPQTGEEGTSPPGETGGGQENTGEADARPNTEQAPGNDFYTNVTVGLFPLVNCIILGNFLPLILVFNIVSSKNDIGSMLFAGLGLFSKLRAWLAVYKMMFIGGQLLVWVFVNGYVVECCIGWDGNLNGEVTWLSNQFGLCTKDQDPCAILDSSGVLTGLLKMTGWPKFYQKLWTMKGVHSICRNIMMQME